MLINLGPKQHALLKISLVTQIDTLQKCIHETPAFEHSVQREPTAFEQSYIDYRDKCLKQIYDCKELYRVLSQSELKAVKRGHWPKLTDDDNSGYEVLT